MAYHDRLLYNFCWFHHKFKNDKLMTILFLSETLVILTLLHQNQLWNVVTVEWCTYYFTPNFYNSHCVNFVANNFLNAVAQPHPPHVSLKTQVSIRYSWSQAKRAAFTAWRISSGRNEIPTRSIWQVLHHDERREKERCAIRRVGHFLLFTSTIQKPTRHWIDCKLNISWQSNKGNIYRFNFSAEPLCQ